MNIDLLREFADLAYTLNYRQTAERMFIGQSTLSKHIMALEKEFGLQLFVRTKQSVRITPAGTAILPKVLKIIENYNDVLKTIHARKGDMVGTLRIGFLDAAVRSVLTKSIQIYRNMYPQMHISLQSCQVGELFDALKNDAVDLGLGLLFPNSNLPPELTFTSLRNDGVSAVIPQNHPLAKKDILLFDDLMHYPLVLPSSDQYPSYATLIRKQIEKSAFAADIICDYTHIDTALIMVESEMGISILPSNVSSNRNTSVFRRIDDFNPQLQIGIFRKTGNHRIGLTEFAEIIRQAAVPI